MRNVTMKCQFLFLSENLLLKLRNMYKVFLRTYIYREIIDIYSYHIFNSCTWLGQIEMYGCSSCL